MKVNEICDSTGKPFILILLLLKHREWEEGEEFVCTKVGHDPKKLEVGGTMDHTLRLVACCKGDEPGTSMQGVGEALEALKRAGFEITNFVFGTLSSSTNWTLDGQREAMNKLMAWATENGVTNKLIADSAGIGASQFSQMKRSEWNLTTAHLTRLLSGLGKLDPAPPSEIVSMFEALKPGFLG